MTTAFVRSTQRLAPVLAVDRIWCPVSACISLLGPGAGTGWVADANARTWRQHQWRAVYLITSLPVAEASPERLLAPNRAHWVIENQLHHVQDVTMDEDRCRVRASARAQSGVRNAALLITGKTGSAIRQARKNFRKDRSGAIRAVTGRIL